MDFAHVDNFDCDLFFGVVVHAAVDAAIGADSDEVVDDVDVNEQVLDGKASFFVLLIGEGKFFGYKLLLLLHRYINNSYCLNT